MAIDDKIRDEKLQHDTNREAAKISALFSGKIDKYEFLTGEQIFHSNQSRKIVQAKFTCSSWGKAFEKQTKAIIEIMVINLDQDKKKKRIKNKILLIV